MVVSSFLFFLSLLSSASRHDSIAVALALKISQTQIYKHHNNSITKKTLDPTTTHHYTTPTQPQTHSKPNPRHKRRKQKCLQLPTKPTAKSTISRAPNSANNSLTFSSPPEPTNLPTKALRGVLLLLLLLLVKFLRRGGYWKGNNLKKEVWGRG